MSSPNEPNGPPPLKNAIANSPENAANIDELKTKINGAVTATKLVKVDEFEEVKNKLKELELQSRISGDKDLLTQFESLGYDYKTDPSFAKGLDERLTVIACKVMAFTNYKTLPIRSAVMQNIVDYNLDHLILECYDALRDIFPGTFDADIKNLFNVLKMFLKTSAGFELPPGSDSFTNDALIRMAFAILQNYKKIFAFLQTAAGKLATTTLLAGNPQLLELFNLFKSFDTFTSPVLDANKVPSTNASTNKGNNANTNANTSTSTGTNASTNASTDANTEEKQIGDMISLVRKVVGGNDQLDIIRYCAEAIQKVFVENEGFNLYLDTKHDRMSSGFTTYTDYKRDLEDALNKVAKFNATNGTANKATVPPSDINKYFVKYTQDNVIVDHYLKDFLIHRNTPEDIVKIKDILAMAATWNTSNIGSLNAAIQDRTIDPTKVTPRLAQTMKHKIDIDKAIALTQTQCATKEIQDVSGKKVTCVPKIAINVQKACQILSFEMKTIDMLNTIISASTTSTITQKPAGADEYMKKAHNSYILYLDGAKKCVRSFNNVLMDDGTQCTITFPNGTKSENDIINSTDVYMRFEETVTSIDPVTKAAVTKKQSKVVILERNTMVDLNIEEPPVTPSAPPITPSTPSAASSSTNPSATSAASSSTNPSAPPLTPPLTNPSAPPLTPSTNPSAPSAPIFKGGANKKISISVQDMFFKAGGKIGDQPNYSLGEEQVFYMDVVMGQAILSKEEDVHNKLGLVSSTLITAPGTGTGPGPSAGPGTGPGPSAADELAPVFEEMNT